MSAVRYCPNCRHPNEPEVDRCSQCGTHIQRNATAQSGHANVASIPDTCSHPGCPHDIGYSPSTRGGGPWFCWRHGPLARQVAPSPPRVSEEQIQIEANAYCRQMGLNTVVERRAHVRELFATPKPSSKQWAHDIIAIAAKDPLNVSALQIRFATEALSRERSREPGEDDA